MMLFAYHPHTTSYVMVVGLPETILFILKVFRKKDVKLHWLFTECHMVVAVCYPIMTKWMNKVSLPNQYQIFQPTFTCWLSLIHYSNMIINVLAAKWKQNKPKQTMLVTTAAMYQVTNHLTNHLIESFYILSVFMTQANLTTLPE